MRFTTTIARTFFTVLPILLAGIVGMALAIFLWRKLENNVEFSLTLLDLAPIFIGMSVLFVFALMTYLYVTVVNLKKLRQTTKQAIHSATQKMHNIRRIAEILLNSNIWLPGLKDYMGEDFEVLTFFEVKDFYKGKSKLAIEFLQENHNFNETENFYLELKSILQTQPKNGKLPDTINYPKNYGAPIIEKWIQHKIGSGLWYFFGYKFTNFKEALDIENMPERHQNKIMALAMNIDAQVFEENSFNEIFLSKLGEYISKTILPDLYKERSVKNSVLPQRVQLLAVLLSLLILVGLLAPLLTLLLGLPILVLIISYSFVCCLFFYTAIAFYQFLKYEITD